MALRGKWAQGIEPRNFTWIIQGRLAVCERPGGYGHNHRKVRRQEEIIWLREQGFTEILSVVHSPHNLHNYDEMGMPWRHRPFSMSEDPQGYLDAFFPELRQLLMDGARIVVHQDEVGDQLCGIVAAYVLWNKLVPAGPQAISVVEQLLHRQLGPTARQLVSMVPRLAAPGVRTVTTVPAGAGAGAGDGDGDGATDGDATDAANAEASASDSGDDA